MGKKRIVKKEGQRMDSSLRARAVSRGSRRKLSEGVLHVQSTYNNTRVQFTDMSGNSVMASSSGALGFKGAKKGTPYAAAKVGEVIGEKAKAIGVLNANVVVKGVGSGRESAIRGFISHGIVINQIRDVTPIPHNGPRPRKARRV